MQARLVIKNSKLNFADNRYKKRKNKKSSRHLAQELAIIQRSTDDKKNKKKRINYSPRSSALKLVRMASRALSASLRITEPAVIASVWSLPVGIFPPPKVFPLRTLSGISQPEIHLARVTIVERWTYAPSEGQKLRDSSFCVAVMALCSL